MAGHPTRESFDDPLTKWEHWVDRAIVDAQERGDFDNLPGHGKPLQMDDNPYAGEWAMGFRVLKNAGMAPPWMELDKEAQALRAEMHGLLAEAAQPSPAAPITSEHVDESSGARCWRSLFRWHAHPKHGRLRKTHNQPRQSDIERSRARARRSYLELAVRLDEKIRLYNRALPANLQHLQRSRLSLNEAAQAFDSAVATGHGGPKAARQQ